MSSLFYFLNLKGLLVIFPPLKREKLPIFLDSVLIKKAKNLSFLRKCQDITRLTVRKNKVHLEEKWT
ncbi:MAG: hypothetical protein CVU39_17460 [Chloroflexi bacterium HGW-Chloroflexi-10]|nr:MAG: hypothetical protein CVU39_17460 [Chloroflexi bacterium HGW-Chloroflexi-10]